MVILNIYSLDESESKSIHISVNKGDIKDANNKSVNKSKVKYAKNEKKDE